MSADSSSDQPRRGLAAAGRLFIEAVRLVWRSNPRLFVIAMAVQTAAGIGVTAQLLLAQGLLEGVVGQGPEQASFDALWVTIVLLVLITIALDVARFSENAFMRLVAENTVRHVNLQIMRVASSVDLESFERSSFFDQLQRAKKKGVSAPIDIASGLLHMLAAILGVLGIVAALAAIEPLLVPMVLFGYAPVWIASSRNSLALYTFDYGLTANDRARSYLETVLTGRETAKEVRAFSLHDFLSQRWQHLYEERMKDVRSLVRQQLRRSSFASTVTSLLMAGTFGVLVALWIGGRIGIAGGATAAIALQQLGSRLRDVSEQANSLYESGLFLEDYVSFMSLGRPASDDASKSASDPLHLIARGLSYTYPSADRPALRGVSIECAPGETIALVGENGSGKTTLAKLLCGLYHPSEGEILCNGVDLETLGVDRLKRSVAVIFQEFARYQLSVWDNLAVGDTARADDRQGMQAAAKAAGAHAFIETLPRGYDTMLSPQFEGGADLSLGQWQRVALARAFFRDAPFLILDEPTASLDAKAEFELFASIASLSTDRTVLLISHRFSSVRTADRIYVLHEGELVESGSHEALMAADGRYAEMFTLQASRYTDTGVPAHAPPP